MATTFTQTKVALDEIAERSERNRKALIQAKALIAQSLADLTSMGTIYAPLLTDVAACLAADPANSAWIVADAELGELAIEFNNIKDDAIALNTAVGN